MQPHPPRRINLRSFRLWAASRPPATWQHISTPAKTIGTVRSLFSARTKPARITAAPGKGDSRVAYYPNGTTNKVGPDTEFELTNVVAYKGRYYANIRITDDHGVVVNSGFVNADYIACDCKSYTVFEDVDEYVYRFGPFSLK